MAVPLPPAQPVGAPELEAALAAVEQRLAALADALRERDAAAVERGAAELHRGLELAMHRFGQAARRGPIPLPLRTRLASASALVAAQRESLARATAALDRAIDVLMPRDAASVYDAGGAAQRSRRGHTTA
jgi:hypothetical protein